MTSGTKLFAQFDPGLWPVDKFANSPVRDFNLLRDGYGAILIDHPVRAERTLTMGNCQSNHRFWSTTRYADLEKPKKKKTLSSTSLVSIPNTIKLSMLNSGLLSLDKVKLSARDEKNPLSQTMPDKPTELRHFAKLCEQRRKFPILYKLEFQTAVKVETNSCKHALRKANALKNQNPKCIPYDYNRVVLDKYDNTPDSDYINASYVDSLLKPNAYIVTQGPTEDTVLDFWRMVWQENCSAIVMLTKTFDFTKRGLCETHRQVNHFVSEDLVA
uniref:Tyrosine-protein phosphatase domain-containing protein n=1 Tax=Anopheles maculatus TaxID=74869 RepID=A0A182TC02_9DIPT